jgi:hypothetical protein
MRFLRHNSPFQRSQPSNSASTSFVLADQPDDLASAANSARGPGDKRTGTFTSGIVSMVGAWTIALFFTGWKHAGENLAEILKQRASELPPPIQMSDALSRNRVE